MDFLGVINESLAGNLILEVGSGRGDTTRELVRLISGQPGAQLVVTDISDAFFPCLREEFQLTDTAVRFVRTSAQELQGVEEGSIDHLVCAYTLCAVNAQAGQAVLALRRFWEVLKTGGKLWIEEEFPIENQENPAQAIWAEKWRILRAVQILTGSLPYQESAPKILADLCLMAGFEAVQWTAHTEVYPPAALDFFQKRLEALLPELTNTGLRLGFMELAQELRERAVLVGSMEVPFYRLKAQKP